MANANIRKALSLAVNRKGLTTTLGGNSLPANTLTPTQLTDVNGEDYTKRISKSVETLYPATPNKSEAVKYFNKGLKELGKSKISFKILSDDTDAGNFDIGVFGWSADFADPISFLDLFTSTNAKEILLNNVDVSPLYYDTNVWMIRPSVKNVIQNRGTWNFKTAYIK